MPALQGRTRRKKRLGQRLAGILEDDDSLTQEQEDKLALWREDPWAFLTGTDVRATATLDFPDGLPIIWTKDERDKIHPRKPFPNKPYLRELIHHIDKPVVTAKRFSLHEAEVHAILKSRQMIISTTLLQYLNHQCSFLAGRVALVSKVTEDEAETLLADKVRYPWQGMPAWLRAQIPQSDRPQDKIHYKRSGSRMVGVAMNVAKREARGGTASDLLVDEAAFQDMLVEVLAAAKPMVTRIFLVSTPDLGPKGSGADEFRQHVEMTQEEVEAAEFDLEEFAREIPDGRY